MTWRRRLAVWLLERVSFEDFMLYVEGLVARAERVPKPGEIVVDSERYQGLVARIRGRHRRAFPHSLRDRMSVDEMVADLDLLPLLDAAAD